MALRTFHANPSLGGFGGESAVTSQITHESEEDCDAFAQIVKELVDNAVDACHFIQQQRGRIRVVMEEVNHPNEEETADCLRVTVSDNGVGMAEIEASVNAFCTSKSSSDQIKSAGRYGIGLTLCLLHAQRLVPNSCASITSATSECERYTRASFVVDTLGDSVTCVKQEELPKNHAHESGTAVSLLVPGGPTAARAWPRLAEYFARFQLSFGLTCGLQVLAPSLSTIPLYIRPNNNTSTTDNDTNNKNTTTTTITMEEEKEQWTDGLSEQEHVPEKQQEDETMQSENKQDDTLSRRREICKAAHAFLKQPVQLEHVAHASHPIGRTSRHRVDPAEQPTLDVVVICYRDNIEDSEEEDHQDDSLLGEAPSAKCRLVRMVNGVPLLDSAEASACGLVQGIQQLQSTWNSFGLQISSSAASMTHQSQQLPNNFGQEEDTEDEDSSRDEREHAEGLAQDVLFVPTFCVRDSTQVAPFLQTGIHDLYQLDSEEEEDSDGRQRRHGFLPAHLRIGNILVIVQIHAKPSSLPLPTLSKGRLPMNNHAISVALELGIMECLTSLQKTSPGLLLTSTQLKETIRDSRYIPALSAALANVVCKSQNTQLQASMVQTIQKWASNTENDAPDEMQQQRQDDDSNRSDEQMVPRVISMESSPSGSAPMQDDDDDVTDASTGVTADAATLCPLLERRLRLVCAPKKRTSSRRGGSRRKASNDSDTDDDAVSLDEFLESGWEGPVRDSEMLQEDHSSTAMESFSDKSRSASASLASSRNNDVNARVARIAEPSAGGRRLNADEDDFDDDSWF